MYHTWTVNLDHMAEGLAEHYPEHDPDELRRACERFLDDVIGELSEDPASHIDYGHEFAWMWEKARRSRGRTSAQAGRTAGGDRAWWGWRRWLYLGLVSMVERVRRMGNSHPVSAGETYRCQPRRGGGRTRSFMPSL